MYVWCFLSCFSRLIVSVFEHRKCFVNVLVLVLERALARSCVCVGVNFVVESKFWYYIAGLVGWLAGWLVGFVDFNLNVAFMFPSHVFCL